MAAPTHGAAGTYRQGSSSTPSFAEPASVVSTSIVVIDMYMDPETIVTLPTGFVHCTGSPLAINHGGGGQHTHVRIWARNPTATAGFYVMTLASSVYSNGQARRMDDCVSTGDPWDTNSGTGAAIATDTGVGSGVTPAVSMTTQNNDQLLYFSGTNWSGGAWTPPTSFTERLDSGDATLTVDTLAQTTAGATGSITATCASADRRSGFLGSLLSVALGGGASVSGTAAAALGGTASSASGTPTVLGTAVKNLGSVTAVASGTPTVRGTAVKNLGALSGATSGTPTVLGIATKNLGALGATISGLPTVFGTASKNLGSLAGTAVAGAAIVTGTATAALGRPVGASTGVRSTTGIGVSLLGSLVAGTSGAVPGVGLVGNAHGPLPLALGAITMHTGTIVGAIT